MWHIYFIHILCLGCWVRSSLTSNSHKNIYYDYLLCEHGLKFYIMSKVTRIIAVTSLSSWHKREFCMWRLQSWCDWKFQLGILFLFGLTGWSNFHVDLLFPLWLNRNLFFYQDFPSSCLEKGILSFEQSLIILENSHIPDFYSKSILCNYWVQQQTTTQHHSTQWKNLTISLSIQVYS